MTMARAGRGLLLRLGRTSYSDQSLDTIPDTVAAVAAMSFTALHAAFRPAATVWSDPQASREHTAAAFTAIHRLRDVELSFDALFDRTTLGAVEQRHTTGGNFDIVACCDLNDPSEQSRVRANISTTKPLEVVMLPMRKTAGPIV